MLKIKNLCVEFPDGTAALKNVSVNVNEEKCIGILGANGAGKSTLLSSVLGLLPPKSGEILADGTLLSKKTLAEIRRKVGMVFQNPDDQLFMPSVYKDLLFGPENYGEDTETAKEAADELLSRLGISELKDRLTHRLSWGEKRKVAIACVLMLKPKIILLDEPTSFLDPKSCNNLKKILSELDCTKIIATHDLETAKEICDRVIILKRGEIFADGNPKELLSDTDLLKKCDLA